MCKYSRWKWKMYIKGERPMYTLRQSKEKAHVHTYSNNILHILYILLAYDVISSMLYIAQS